MSKHVFDIYQWIQSDFSYTYVLLLLSWSYFVLITVLRIYRYLSEFQYGPVQPLEFVRGQLQLRMKSIQTLEELVPFFTSVCNDVTWQLAKNTSADSNDLDKQNLVSKSDCHTLGVVYFDQLLARTRKLVEILFFSCFQPFLLILNLLQWFHAWNQQKMSEKLKTAERKYFDQR